MFFSVILAAGSLRLTIIFLEMKEVIAVSKKEGSSGPLILKIRFFVARVDKPGKLFSFASTRNKLLLV